MNDMAIIVVISIVAITGCGQMDRDTTVNETTSTHRPDKDMTIALHWFDDDLPVNVTSTESWYSLNRDTDWYAFSSNGKPVAEQETQRMSAIYVDARSREYLNYNNVGEQQRDAVKWARQFLGQEYPKGLQLGVRDPRIVAEREGEPEWYDDNFLCPELMIITDGDYYRIFTPSCTDGQIYALRTTVTEDGN